MPSGGATPMLCARWPRWRSSASAAWTASRDASERYFIYRVLRALELSQLMARALARGAMPRPDPAASTSVASGGAARSGSKPSSAAAEQVRGQLAELRGAEGRPRARWVTS